MSTITTPATLRVFAFFNSKKGWHGGSLYDARENAERALAEFNAKHSFSQYDCIIELNGTPPDLALETKT